MTLPGFDSNLLYVVTRTPHSFTYFAFVDQSLPYYCSELKRISAVVAQITILASSVLKYNRSGLGRAPIVTLMRRDGTLAFIVLFSECYDHLGSFWAKFIRSTIFEIRLPLPDMRRSSSFPSRYYSMTFPSHSPDGFSLSLNRRQYFSKPASEVIEQYIAGLLT